MDTQHPTFPQNDLIVQTLHTTYPAYAAYYDLGREQARRSLAEGLPDPSKDDESACAVPRTARPSI
jgi:hypothetical protein